MGENIIYLIPIFGMVFVGWFLYLDYRDKQIKNKEKSALIEKGIDPSLFDSKPKNQLSSFKTGLLLIGVALGIMAGYILNLTLGIPNFVAYSTMIFVLCGIILVYFHKSQTD